jgi:Gpi18-like mannosyltransferase
MFEKQPFYEYITWRVQVDTYGPLWEYASGAVAWAVHALFGRADSLIAYIVGYRLLALMLAGLCAVLIALIVRRSAPQLVPAALLAWLWNPLILITSAIGAHNDLLMIVAILAALLLFQRRRWVWGLLALALAAHVKLTALLILPILGLWMLRRCG